MLERMILRTLIAILIAVPTACHNLPDAHVDLIYVNAVWRCGRIAAELRRLPADPVAAAAVVVIVGV